MRDSPSSGLLCIPQEVTFEDMEWRTRIVSDKDIVLGKPVIKGTRISVELILELMAEGWTEAQVLESYPNITANDLKAAYAYSLS